MSASSVPGKGTLVVLRLPVVQSDLLGAAAATRVVEFPADNTLEEPTGDGPVADKVIDSTSLEAVAVRKLFKQLPGGSATTIAADTVRPYPFPPPAPAAPRTRLALPCATTALCVARVALARAPSVLQTARAAHRRSKATRTR